MTNEKNNQHLMLSFMHFSFLSEVLCKGFKTRSRLCLLCIRQANYKTLRHLKVRNVGDVDNIFK